MIYAFRSITLFHYSRKEGLGNYFTRTVSISVLTFDRGFDLHMKAVLNGKERDAEDWTKLFAAVDPRLHFNGVKQHPKSRWATIEAVWQGESYIVQSEL